MTLFGVIRRPFGLVVAAELFTSIFDFHFFLALAAARSSERCLSTVLPVTSDLIRTIGSSTVPTRVTVPPLGPLIDTRLALATLWTTPVVREPP
jgi:hypothetical protein